MKIFLLSESFVNIRKKDKKVAIEIAETNEFAENLRKSLKKCQNFLFFCNNSTNYWQNKKNAKFIFKGLKRAGMNFKRYFVLADKTIKKAKEYVENADLIFLQGGTLDGQLEFAKKINFTELVKNSHAVLAGKSAGAMNLSKEVYFYPEQADEKDHAKWLEGLGLTDYTIIPHFIKEGGNEFNFGGFDLINDFFLPDSKGKKIYALKNGSYIFIDEGEATLYGESYIFEDCQMKQICTDGEKLKLN